MPRVQSTAAVPALIDSLYSSRRLRFGDCGELRPVLPQLAVRLISFVDRNGESVEIALSFRFPIPEAKGWVPVHVDSPFCREPPRACHRRRSTRLAIQKAAAVTMKSTYNTLCLDLSWLKRSVFRASVRFLNLPIRTSPMKIRYV